MIGYCFPTRILSALVVQLMASRISYSINPIGTQLELHFYVLLGVHYSSILVSITFDCLFSWPLLLALSLKEYLRMTSLFKLLFFMIVWTVVLLCFWMSINLVLACCSSCSITFWMPLWKRNVRNLPFECCQECILYLQCLCLLHPFLIYKRVYAFPSFVAWFYLPSNLINGNSVGSPLCELACLCKLTCMFHWLTYVGTTVVCPFDGSMQPTARHLD